jgi:hypothetical protein
MAILQAQTVITLSEHRDFLEQNFESCVLAGRATNRYSIVNRSWAGWDRFSCAATCVGPGQSSGSTFNSMG